MILPPTRLVANAVLLLTRLAAHMIPHRCAGSVHGKSVVFLSKPMNKWVVRRFTIAAPQTETALDKAN